MAVLTIYHTTMDFPVTIQISQRSILEVDYPIISMSYSTSMIVSGMCTVVEALAIVHFHGETIMLPIPNGYYNSGLFIGVHAGARYYFAPKAGAFSEIGALG